MKEQQPKRPPFKVAEWAAIKHLNVRKEWPEDDKDFIFRAVVHALLQTALATEVSA